MEGGHHSINNYSPWLSRYVIHSGLRVSDHHYQVATVLAFCESQTAVCYRTLSCMTLRIYCRRVYWRVGRWFILLSLTFRTNFCCSYNRWTLIKRQYFPTSWFKDRNYRQCTVEIFSKTSLVQTFRSLDRERNSFMKRKSEYILRIEAFLYVINLLHRFYHWQQYFRYWILY